MLRGADLNDSIERQLKGYTTKHPRVSLFENVNCLSTQRASYSSGQFSDMLYVDTSQQS